MPNWCMNELLVQGPKKDLARFKKAVALKNSALSLKALVPEPEPAVMREQLVHPGPDILPPNTPAASIRDQDLWYHWRCSFWGTKADVEAKLVVEDDTRLTYTFDSAWSPPGAAIRAGSKKWPTLVFGLQYEEPTMGFEGELVVKNGETLLEDDREQHSLEAVVREVLDQREHPNF